MPIRSLMKLHESVSVMGLRGIYTKNPPRIRVRTQDTMCLLRFLLRASVKIYKIRWKIVQPAVNTDGDSITHNKKGTSMGSSSRMHKYREQMQPDYMLLQTSKFLL